MPFGPLILRTIPAASQRYRTVGDWYLSPPPAPNAPAADLIARDQAVTVISVSDTGNPDEAFLVAVHELIEWWLCQRAGITQEQVDVYDAVPLREPYLEHGDMPEAPYHRQHDVALVVERLLAHELGIDWAMYEERLDEVLNEAPHRPA